MDRTPPPRNNRNNTMPRIGRRRRRSSRPPVIRQPDFRTPPPDGYDKDSGYDGPGENKDNKQPPAEQPELKF